MTIADNAEFHSQVHSAFAASVVRRVVLRCFKKGSALFCCTKPTVVKISDAFRQFADSMSLPLWFRSDSENCDG